MTDVINGAVYIDDILLQFLLSNVSLLIFFDSSKYFTEKFEDTKGVIRIRKSKNGRQHYDQKIKK